jgi:hypothetical protein
MAGVIITGETGITVNTDTTVITMTMIVTPKVTNGPVEVRVMIQG